MGPLGFQRQFSMGAQPLPPPNASMHAATAELWKSKHLTFVSLPWNSCTCTLEISVLTAMHMHAPQLRIVLGQHIECATSAESGNRANMRPILSWQKLQKKKGLSKQGIEPWSPRPQRGVLTTIRHRRLEGPLQWNNPPNGGSWAIKNIYIR